MRASGQRGFTLVELLVVITILGVLAAIVVFSVAGVRDKGEVAAFKTDQAVLRTAEEAYYAKFGEYGTLQQLVDAGFLKNKSTLNAGLVLTNGGQGFALGDVATIPNGGTAVFLAASNTAPAFNFLSSSFIPKNDPYTITYGATGTLLSQATGNPGDASDHRGLFAAADRANAETAAAANAASGESAKPYARGQLGIVSCNGSTPPTISQVATATCATSANLTAALADTATCGVTHARNALTAQDVVSLISGACWTAHGVRVTIADPGAGCGTTGAVAPYGCAGKQAMVNAGLSESDFTSWVGSRIIYGAGNNISVSLNNLRSGAADIGFTPGSYLISPNGNEKNPWNLVSSGLYDPIFQYAVVLNHGTAAEKALAKKFLAYVRSGTGQAVLAQFGYLPLN